MATTDPRMTADPRADGLMLRDHWYVAAWSDEVGRAPLARILLGEMVMLYRRQDGAVVALENRCPHRNLPLSQGRLAGDEIECGYHGLVFGPDGRCTHMPGAETPPAWACVRRYPAIERQGWVMVWMGDPDRADPTSAPKFAVRRDDATWLTVSGYSHAKCGYRLVLDNLLDLSHLAYVHSSTTGNRELAEQAAIACEVAGDHVRVTRWMENIEAAPAFVDYAGYGGAIDRWQGSEFMPPSYIHVNSGTESVGAGAGPADRMNAQGRWGFVVYHGLTPETEKTTHQFWSVSLPAQWVDPEKHDEFIVQMKNIPAEDLAIYEAQQRAIDLDPDAVGGDANPHGTIPADEGLLAMRRILRRLYGEERRRDNDTPTGASR